MEVKSGYTEERREMFVGSIQNVHGESLVVQMSCLPEMGATNATAHIVLALREFRPRFAAMTGICAGDREKVTLGDLVIATRAYEYEAGKVIIEDGKPILLNDVKTFSPNDNIIGYANLFEEWREDVSKLRRPPSRRQQQEWLLSELSSTGKRLKDLQLQGLIENMPDWRTITTEMERGDNPLLTGNGSLTEFARRRRRSSPPYKKRHDKEIQRLARGGRPPKSLMIPRGRDMDVPQNVPPSSKCECQLKLLPRVWQCRTRRLLAESRHFTNNPALSVNA
jgi:hypothetical protein